MNAFCLKIYKHFPLQTLNLRTVWISSSLLCIYLFSLTHHMTMFKWRVCGPYCEDALGIVSIGRLFPLYIHTDYLILNTSTSMLIPWHIFENICCVSLESCLWAFSMLSELIPKVSDSWACTMYFKDIHAMQHLHIQNKHIYSESALQCIGWCLCHLVHSLEHTDKATVTRLWAPNIVPSLKVYFRSRFLQVFTSSL